MSGRPAAPSVSTPLHAAAAILVVVALFAIQTRATPAAGWALLQSLLAAAVVLPWAFAAAGSERGRDRLSGVASTLLVTGLLLVLFVIGWLIDLLGGDGGSGTTLIVSLLFAALAGYPGWLLNSPICALLSSAALGFAFLSAVDLTAGIDTPDTGRTLMLILAVAYALAAVVLLGRRYRHAVQHVIAAGLAVGVLVIITSVEQVSGLIGGVFGPAAGLPGGAGDAGGNVGWELVTLVGAGAVLAFGVWRREPGPSVVGSLALANAVTFAAISADDSIVGWPLALLLIALAGVAAVFATGGAKLPDLSRLGGGGSAGAGAGGAPDRGSRTSAAEGAAAPPPGGSQPPPSQRPPSGSGGAPPTPPRDQGGRAAEDRPWSTSGGEPPTPPPGAPPEPPPPPPGSGR